MEFRKQRAEVFSSAKTRSVTITGVAKRLRAAFTTAQRAIDRLRKNKALIEISGAKRDRVFCAKRILEILEEPARLTPLQG